MSTPPFPDAQVAERIERLSQQFDLKIVNIKYIDNRDLDALVGKNGDSKWVWQLAKANSPVVVSIGFFFPSFINHISFVNSSPGGKSGYFAFQNYLSSHLKKVEDYERIQKVIAEQSWSKNWVVELDILEEHLKKNLWKVINGEEWPDIPFNWEDYVEPAALDRIYEDQRRFLDEEVPGKPQNAWVYFLDFFRKQ